MRHPPLSSRVYRKRSCRRCSLDCQNSITLTRSLYPPQSGGLGTSSLNLASYSLQRSSSRRLSGITLLYSAAQAATRLSRDRLLKYASDSSAGAGSTLPSALTCRLSLGQWNTAAALGLSLSSSPLRLV